MCKQILLREASLERPGADWEEGEPGRSDRAARWQVLVDTRLTHEHAKASSASPVIKEMQMTAGESFHLPNGRACFSRGHLLHTQEWEGSVGFLESHSVIRNEDDSVISLLGNDSVKKQQEM